MIINRIKISQAKKGTEKAKQRTHTSTPRDVRKTLKTL